MLFIYCVMCVSAFSVFLHWQHQLVQLVSPPLNYFRDVILFTNKTMTEVRLRNWETLSSRLRTSNNEDEVLLCVGVVGVLDDVQAFILLLYVLQNQVAQRIEAAAWVHYLARS